ncbi:MAG TPA: DoxX family membrane protein [Candidatus Caldiarchaeum subterraneum]|uniref:DoxX family membrane protein n=1 Tax=Caldiarchaeum subterraneum TaxID=311458 RepID=A0A833ECD1_CALS0|nr:DoxX family membrane protein [Candidatus Caldarchaeum subterraneum]
MGLQETLRKVGGEWVYVVAVALATAHVAWAASLLLEQYRYIGRIPSLELFAALHMASAALLAVGRKALGGGVSLAILVYYWLYVKPLEPVAEPQSVGLIFLSAALITGEVVRTHDINAALLRISIAYPFLEWGLDAFRNPGHFIEFMQGNYLTSVLIPAHYLPYAAFILGFIEVVLAVLLTLGIAVRRASKVSAVVLLVFIIVAGYPLALPQNIPLITAAYVLSLLGAGRFSLSRVFSSFS